MFKWPDVLLSIKARRLRTSTEVQWLRLCAANAGGKGLIPVVKNLPANSGNSGDMDSIHGGEDPLEEEMTTLSSILAWKNPMDRGAWRASVHWGAELDMTEHTRRELRSCILHALAQPKDFFKSYQIYGGIKVAMAEPLQTFDRVHFSLWGRRRASGDQGADWSVQPLTPSVRRSPLCSPTPTTDAMKDSEDCSDLCASCSVVSESLQPLWLQPTRLLCPWNSPGKNTGVGSHPLLLGSSQPRDQTQVSHIAGTFFTIWSTREASDLRNCYLLKKQTPSRNVQRISSTGTRGGFDRLDNSLANHLDKWHHLEENLPNRV